MKQILGLDIGSNSIGWALVEQGATEVRIVAMGVRVFPEGVDRDQQGGEQSKSENRRLARGMRRQIARRARRKKILRGALVECGLYPEDKGRQLSLDRMDPYELRARALREPVTPHELGRVLLHLCQRRGFLSNRKTNSKKKKEDSETLQEMSELASEMGSHTLGEHFAALRADDDHVRVRGRHTRRDMYEHEFERIWQAQSQHHPELLSEALKYGTMGQRAYPREPDPRSDRKRDRKRQTVLSLFGLHGIIFFQRAMYWPRSVVGACTLEPKQPRCPRADRHAQRFRILQEVNNLRTIDPRGRERRLTPEERCTVIGLLEKKEKVKFEDLRKRLNLDQNAVFNLERGDRGELKGMTTDVLLSKKDFFGKRWSSLDEPTKDGIVRSLIEDTEQKRVRTLAEREWGCDSATAERLTHLDLEAGYMSVSRVAIDKLLPHLERGLPLMGNDPSDSALHAAGYLRPDEQTIGQRDDLPPPPDEITNPLVRQAVHEVRKLVNALIRRWGKPNAIHIELAREVQGGLAQRQAYSKKIHERERQREAAAQEIREWGHKPTREAIQRFLLWKEQREECLYSGRTISPNQLFGGEVDIDHLLPYSRSLDDSMQNKVVCFKAENQAKGDRTVHEWLAEGDPEKYEEILQRARRLP
ncbi:MAG: type II CRISPR RNA-guided endonuclease Cas9, partial [Isosphaeraceae bacterium]